MSAALNHAIDLCVDHGGIEPALAQGLASELVRASGLLAELAFDLASEPDTLHRHMTALQAIDLITQTQLAVADVLRSAGSSADRVSGVTVEAIADRLRAAIA